MKFYCSIRLLFFFVGINIIRVNETVVEWRHFVLYFDDDGFKLP